MKAEISQFGSHRAQQFTGVYQQQGRMLLDRDWNDLCEILRDLGTAVSSQAIGTGVPRHGGLLAGPAPTLTLRPAGGLVAAAGVIGEVRPRDPESAAGIYRNQLHLPERVRAPPPGTGERPADDGPPAERREAEPPTQPLLLGSADNRLLYVDVWDRTVTAFESDEAVWGDFIDPALHGADTCFRQQRLVQIKAAKEDDLDRGAGADPCLPRFLPERIPGTGDAVFTAEFTRPEEDGDPCDPCAKQVSVVRSVTNHLFRLEVHSVMFDETRQPVGLQLKWSRDNGARELRAAEVAALGDRAGHSYEYFSDATERLLGMPSDDWAAEEFLRGVLDPADPAALAVALPRAREWDGWCSLEKRATGWSVVEARHLAKRHDDPAPRFTISTAEGVLTVALIDEGFKFTLTLAGKSFLAGDYWLALVRARAPADRRVRVASATPVGVEHRYCILGVNAGDGADMRFPNLSAHDLRRLQHPSLTCLDASDVGYATDCPSGLFNATHDTVKKALDQICRIRAEHVAYAADCPSGLFGRTENTVKKALDRICRIGAEHVAFKKPCDTSIYSQAGAENIKTVADALALLCTVSAEQIGFEPTCSYLKDALREPKSRNVRDALEALCRRGREKADLPFIRKTSWQNDGILTFAQLKAGLTVTFSEAMDGRASSDAFIVTWEANLGLKSAAGAALSEFLTPQIMLGTVALEEEGGVVRFRPTPAMTADAFAILFREQRPPNDVPGIRCRVRLIGRAIFAERGSRPLDGHVPMRPTARQIDLDFGNPGLGQPSDFESWFYLVPGGQTPPPPPPPPTGPSRESGPTPQAGPALPASSPEPAPPSEPQPPRSPTRKARR